MVEHKVAYAAKSMIRASSDSISILNPIPEPRTVQSRACSIVRSYFCRRYDMVERLVQCRYAGMYANERKSISSTVLGIVEIVLSGMLVVRRQISIDALRQPLCHLRQLFT